ncbi:MAG TPA: TonB family protein [Pyrinomonadaceae bacterium]|jgi:protein TonB
MFDKLVESEPVGAIRSRRNYFVVTTLAMSVLSLTAVVISIFADDYSMNASIELAELIAPVDMAQVAPEQPQPHPPIARTQQSSALPTREVAQAPVDDTRMVPTAISTTPNDHLSIPNGKYVLGIRDTNPLADGSARESGSVGLGDRQGGLTTQPDVSKPSDEEAPAPRAKKPAPIVSIGVANGRAISLPKPAYPPAAQAVGAGGTVEVQVLIDETGRVLSAHAASGSPLLRSAAERAALSARFTPTLLSNVPVKVSGIITYNFVRS